MNDRQILNTKRNVFLYYVNETTLLSGHQDKTTRSDQHTHRKYVSPNRQDNVSVGPGPSPLNYVIVVSRVYGLYLRTPGSSLCSTSHKRVSITFGTIRSPTHRILHLRLQSWLVNISRSLSTQGCSDYSLLLGVPLLLYRIVSNATLLGYPSTSVGLGHWRR